MFRNEAKKNFFPKRVLVTASLAFYTLLASPVVAFAEGERDFNLRLHQAPLIFSDVGRNGSPFSELDLMIKVAPNVSVGPIVGWFGKNGIDASTNSSYGMDGQLAGVRADLALTGEAFRDGIFLTNMLAFQSWKNHESLSGEGGCSGNVSSAGSGLLGSGGIGYQVFWRAGYNLSFGYAYSALARNTQTSVEDAPSCITNAGKNAAANRGNVQLENKRWLDLSFGYSF